MSEELKPCIFDSYFTKGKLCDKNFDCSICEIKEEIKEIVQETYLLMLGIQGANDG